METTANKTNQTFNLKRFWQLCKSSVKQRKRGLMWFCAVISIIYFFILVIIISNDDNYDLDIQMGMYTAGLLTTGFVFAGLYFSTLMNERTALNTLMQPASTFEKWLLAVITVLIIYPIIYTLLFWIMTFPVTINKSPLFIPLFQYRLYDYNQVTLLNQLNWYMFYQMMCAYTLFATLMAKKYALLKAFVGAFLLALFLSFVLGNIEPNSHNIFYFFDEDATGASLVTYLTALLFWIIPTGLLWFACFSALNNRDLA